MKQKKSYIVVYSNMYHNKYDGFVEGKDDIRKYIDGYICHLKGGLYMIFEIDKTKYLDLYTILDSIPL